MAFTPGIAPQFPLKIVELRARGLRYDHMTPMTHSTLRGMILLSHTDAVLSPSAAAAAIPAEYHQYDEARFTFHVGHAAADLL